MHAACYTETERRETETRDRERDIRAQFSSAQLPSTHQVVAPPLETSAAAPCRDHGLVCAALRCLSKIQAPIIQKSTPCPNVIRCLASLPISLFPPRSAQVHRLIALVGATARACIQYLVEGLVCMYRSRSGRIASSSIRSIESR